MGMRLPLLLYPNQFLTQVSTPVDPEYAKTEDFKLFLSALSETLVWFRGVGISAIQTGFADRVFSMKTQQGIQHFVNPEITNVNDEPIPMKEGCLSVPGVVETVERYPWVVVSALDIETGTRRLYDLDGVEAQCAQHEMDHLDGKMFTDGFGPVKRGIVRRKIQKQVRLNPLFKELR